MKEEEADRNKERGRESVTKRKIKGVRHINAKRRKTVITRKRIRGKKRQRKAVIKDKERQKEIKKEIKKERQKEIKKERQ